MLLPVYNIVITLAAIIHGCAAFCATPFIDPCGWKLQQRSQLRLPMAGGDDELLKKLLRETTEFRNEMTAKLEKFQEDTEKFQKETKKDLDTLKLRTGHLVEGMVVSEINSEKYSVRNALDVVKLISPNEAGSSDQQKQAKKINDHLFNHCTKKLVNEIVGEKIPEPSDTHSWERAAYQALHAKRNEVEGILGQNSAKFQIIRQFMGVIEKGFPDNEWKTKSPVIQQTETQTFNYGKAMGAFVNNRDGLLPSLMFADGLLEKWDYRGDDNWAVIDVDIDGIRHDYARDHSTIITIIEVKSSTAGKQKARNQLLFRAHLLDKYASIAWGESEFNHTLAMNLEIHFYDSNSNWPPQSDVMLLTMKDEDGKFDKADPVRMYQYHVK